MGNCYILTEKDQPKKEQCIDVIDNTTNRQVKIEKEDASNEGGDHASGVGLLGDNDTSILISSINNKNDPCYNVKYIGKINEKRSDK